MMKKVVVNIFILAALSMVSIGCGAKSTPTSTTAPELILTAANQTAEAMVTQIFALTPSATATAPVTPSPTYNAVQTMAAQTQSALLTQAAALTPSPTQTTATTPVPPGGSDRAVFVADVTIPDKTVVNPGASFTKTWKLQNAGTSTWTSDYSLAFSSGDKLGDITSVDLAQSVAPGAQIDVSVNMVAPTSAGSYQSNWKMKNAAGQFFNDPVYVLITVGSAGGATPSPTSGTPVVNPTATSTGAPGNPITSLTMSVSEPTFSGQCPHDFNYSATLTVNQSATLTYQLEAESETPGFTFNLPGPQTQAFSPGTYSIPFVLTFTSSGAGWVKLHVTSPVNVSSNQAAFNLTCVP